MPKLTLENTEQALRVAALNYSRVVGAGNGEKNGVEFSLALYPQVESRLHDAAHLYGSMFAASKKGESSE